VDRQQAEDREAAALALHEKREREANERAKTTSTNPEPSWYVPDEQPEFKHIRQETAEIFARLPIGNDQGRTILGRDLLCRLMELGHVEVVARYAIELMEQREELCRVSGKTVPKATYRQTVQLAQWANVKGPGRKTASRKMTACWRNAYVAYKWALSLCKEDATNEEIHNYLLQHDLPGELKDWKVPKFKTWQRYVQKAKQFLSESDPRLQEIQKGFSKSVVGANAVEPVEDTGDDLTRIPLSPERERATRIERLSELATDIFELQADSKTLHPEKMQDFWNEAAVILRWLNVDTRTIDRLQSSRDAEGLATLANTLQSELP
jgi:hypothetical protein